MTEEYILFSVRDIKSVQPPPTPPVKGAVPLFNPSEIQLERNLLSWQRRRILQALKERILLERQPMVRIVNLMYSLSLEVPRKTFFVFTG